MKRFLLLLNIFVSFFSAAAAQHFLDGTWTGDYKGFLALITGVKKVVINLQVSTDNTVVGTSHLVYNNKKNYEHYAVHGFYKPEDSTITISEDSVIAVHTFLGSTCTGDYVMKLSVEDTVLKFKGRWLENGKTGSGCGNSGVWLSKSFSKPVKKKADPNLQRFSDIQKLIEIDTSESDSIKIELSDNAQIDGDIVAVYWNDSLIIAHQKLLAAPVTFYISLPKGEGINNLKMIAESLGFIPPCTALMKVSTKEHQYEVNLSSSMSNNSVVQFFLKE